MENTVQTEALQSGFDLSEVLIKKTIGFVVNKVFDKFSKRKSMQGLKDGLQAYLLYCYKRNININSLVLGNSKRSILDIYQPLTIYNYYICTEKQKIESANIKFLRQHNNILLVDSAGMGKSTLLKYLSIQTLAEGNTIPVLIELRNLQGKEIVDYIKQEIEPLQKDIRTADLKEVLKEGGFLILFDGYDEIEDKYKQNIGKKIQEFVSKAENNYYILTSRDEPGLSSFSDFQRFGIQALSIYEAYELLKKIDNSGSLSNLIINKIKLDKNLDNVKELLGNPLLVSILYKTFECGSSVDIPYKKSEFYNQIYYALYERHDKSKDPSYEHEKRSRLDCSDFNAVLRRLGFKCLEKNKIEYDTNELYDIIECVLKEMKWLKTDKKSVVNDLIYAVPFFQEFNIYIQWIHKSFMEYFAAKFICSDINNKGEIFEILAKKAYKYNNVLEFCYEMDVKTYRCKVIYPILRSFLTDYENSELLDVRIEDFNIRKNFMMIYEAKIIKISKEDLLLSDKELWKKTSGNKLDCSYKIYREYEIILCWEEVHDGIKMLIKLMKDKKIDVFKHKKDYVQFINSCDFTDIESGIYNVDLSSQNPFNTHNNFLKINTLLLNEKIYMIHFDSNKCKKMYEEIKQEVKEISGTYRYNL